MGWFWGMRFVLLQVPKGAPCPAGVLVLIFSVDCPDFGFVLKEAWDMIDDIR